MNAANEEQEGLFTNSKVSLATLKGKLDFEIVPYAFYRRESRLDTIFGFKSWDSDYADNYSSVEDTNNNEDLETNADTFARVGGRKCKLSCSICLEAFVGADTIVKLGCHYKHIYHEKCMEDWLIQDIRNSVSERRLLLSVHDLTV